MTALYIILGIAALIAFLAFLRITLILDAEEELTLVVKVLCFHFRLLPKRKRLPKLRHFRIKTFRRRRLKEEKRFRKKELARAASEKKEKQAEAVKAEGKEVPKRSLKENVAFGIDLVKHVVWRVLKTFGKRLRVDIYRFDITVATGDAAKTAITYGYVCQGVAYLEAVLDRYLNVRYPQKQRDAVAVRVDYLGEKSTFKVHMAFHIRVWQVLSLGLDALKGYLTMPKHEPKTEPKDKAASKDKADSDSSDPFSGQAAPMNHTENKNEKAPEQAGKEV